MQEHRSYLEPKEVERLEHAATNLRDRLLIRLLFHLGCRISEALAITVQDVDLARGAITIQHLKVKLNLTCPRCGVGLGRRHIFCPGCGARVDQAVAKEMEHRRQRTLPLDSGTLAMLKEYMDRGGPVTKNGKVLLFGVNRHRGWQVIKECARKAGLPDLINPETGRKRGVSPHRLRDAFAVHAVKLDDSGDGLRLLQEWLGHANIGTTMRYRKVGGRELKEWYQRLWTKKEAADGHAP